MADLDGRKRQILQAVVEDYVRSGDPVGSRTIARKYLITSSPATIRNELADLEELGYLDQPHTSAGRVPSDQGYRFYVDRLMQPPQLSRQDMLRIRNAYRQGAQSLEWLIHETVKLLGTVSEYTVLALVPQPGPQRLQGLDIVPCSGDQAVLVLVTDQGLVFHRMIEVPPDQPPESLAETGGLLRESLLGRSIEDIRGRALSRLANRLRSRAQVAEQVFELLLASLASADDGEQVVVQGASRIAQQREYQDLARLTEILGFLEQRRAVRDLLLEMDEGIGAVIGREHRMAQAFGTGVVMANLPGPGGSRLRFGVVGPKRLDYARATAVLGAIAEQLGEMLHE